MIDYIKTAIISFITSIFSPVAASSSAHFVFLENVLSFSKNKEESAFYYSIISLTFALTAIFFVRKIYIKGFKSLSKKKDKSSVGKAYKDMMTGLLISLIPAVLMLVPISKERLLLDVFTDYLWKNNILVSSFCCFAMGFVILVAAWFSKQKNIEKHRNSKKTDVLRISLYQIAAHIFPGLSSVSLSATGLIVSGVEESVIMRDVLIYISPSMLLISVMRIVRTALLGVELDVLKIILCAVFAFLGNILMLNVVSKINIKKSFVFFSVYSVIFAIFMTVSSLLIL